MAVSANESRLLEQFGFKHKLVIVEGCRSHEIAFASCSSEIRAAEDLTKNVYAFLLVKASLAEAHPIVVCFLVSFVLPEREHDYLRDFFGLCQLLLLTWAWRTLRSNPTNIYKAHLAVLKQQATAFFKEDFPSESRAQIVRAVTMLAILSEALGAPLAPPWLALLRGRHWRDLATAVTPFSAKRPKPLLYCRLPLYLITPDCFTVTGNGAMLTYRLPRVI